MAVLFAATYPERTTALVLYSPSARGVWGPDYPWAPTEDDWISSYARRVSGGAIGATSSSEVRGEHLAGIAVHTGARIASAADPGHLFVSSTVKDLVSGAGIEFTDQGEHELKRVGSWRLYSVGDA